MFCQLELLRQCFPQSVRNILKELPDSLDETYERILREIPKPNQRHARQLLHCLVAAARPLEVEELAEILAFDFSTEGIPKLNPGWRWIRTISETDNTWFTLLTMNQHPVHFDEAYAAQSEFKRPLVNSCLTLSIVVGMSVSDVSQKAIGNLGWNDIKLTAPVFVGDTIYAESEVLAKRESASRPGQGLVTVRTIGKKGDGTQFMSFERTALIAKRGHGIEN